MSFVLAQIFGLYFFTLGLVFLLNPERFQNIFKQVRNDPNFLFLGGIIAVLIGAVIVSVHNIWILAWPVLITILGWWSLIKGFLILSYPKFLDSFAFLEGKSPLFYRGLALLYVLLGLFLLYNGFRVTF